MAKPRKGVVPPQLRPFLFKKKGSRAKTAAGTAPSVTHMPKKGRGRGKGKRVGRAALPLIPTLVAVSPELLVGIRAAQEAAQGQPAGTIGDNAVKRLAQLYGGKTTDPNTMGLKENVAMKVIGGVLHIVMRKAGMRIPISKRLTLF